MIQLDRVFSLSLSQSGFTSAHLICTTTSCCTLSLIQDFHSHLGSPTGLCPESPALLSRHTRLRILSQLHFYCQICWWCGFGPHFQQWWDSILGWGRETYIMVPGQLSLSEREQNLRADCGLHEETAAALHSSYDQWDPCGEGEQLQVPRCKHLRGPDLDCTHSNTGQESQSKTVPSATDEEIQGLTSNPENFLFRVHRKCTDSQCGMVTPQIRTAKLLQSKRVVRLAERISGSALPSLQDIYLKRCKSRAAKIIKDSNHPGNCLLILLPSGKRFRSMMAKTKRLGRSFFPQAIRLLNSNSVK